MKSFFGRLHLGRLPDEQTRHKQLLRELRKIMATQTEIAAEMVSLKADLESSTARITKIGTETDVLLSRIKTLEDTINAGTVSPELQAAFDGVKSQASVLASTAATVDDKVPDA